MVLMPKTSRKPFKPFKTWICIIMHSHNTKKTWSNIKVQRYKQVAWHPPEQWVMGIFRVTHVCYAILIYQLCYIPLCRIFCLWHELDNHWAFWTYLTNDFYKLDLQKAVLSDTFHVQSQSGQVDHILTLKFVFLHSPFCRAEGLCQHAAIREE